MKEMTARRFMLEQTWKEINAKKMISVDDLFELMDQVGKLMQNYDDAVKSRDQWKQKFKELKEELVKQKLILRKKDEN